MLGALWHQAAPAHQRPPAVRERPALQGRQTQLTQCSGNWLVIVSAPFGSALGPCSQLSFRTGTTRGTGGNRGYSLRFRKGTRCALSSRSDTGSLAENRVVACVIDIGNRALSFRFRTGTRCALSSRSDTGTVPLEEVVNGRRVGVGHCCQAPRPYRTPEKPLHCGSSQAPRHSEAGLMMPAEFR